MVELVENSSSNSASAGDASVSSDHCAAPPPAAATAPPKKKKRNLPGMPDPDAEVIALSPRTLMATNRFVCEVCSKGFQREQNLQLHRRGHNLPWKLRQRTGNEEARKRVYVCPEPGCVHHEPSRALGDLTGIKKHFSRKHGEKKWKCDRCSKKYAVQSDWKAHSKTCGTKEYRCDCGTLFSRRDSFITHRAFCDALAEESAKTQTTNTVRSDEEENTAPLVAAVDDAPHVVIPAQPAETQQEQEPEEPAGMLQYLPPNADAGSSSSTMSSNGNGSNGRGTSLFASLFSSSTAATSSSVGHSATTFSDFIGLMNRSSEPTSLCLSTIAPNPSSSLFSSLLQPQQQFTAPPPVPSPHLSATALLQKAAQMGATTATSSSFLRGFGLAPSSSSAALQEDSSLQWDGRGHRQNLDPGLGLGLGYGLSLGYDAGNLMLGPSSSFFGTKPATLDLLGLGIGPGGSTTGELSALITSMGGGGLDVGPDASYGSAQSWEGSDRKPAIL